MECNGKNGLNWMEGFEKMSGEKDIRTIKKGCQLDRKSRRKFVQTASKLSNVRFRYKL